MDKLLNVCRLIYHDFEITIYDEDWSQGDEFLVFKIDNKYLGRIHKYQLCDIIKNDLIYGDDKHLRNVLKY